MVSLRRAVSPGGGGGWTTPDSSSGKATRNARGSGATELVSGAARDRQQKQANANRRSGILKTRLFDMKSIHVDFFSYPLHANFVVRKCSLHNHLVFVYIDVVRLVLIARD